eukprot:2123347-Amphidinium_carterae.1
MWIAESLPTATPEEKAEYKRLLLSMPFRWRNLPSEEDCHIFQISMREAVTQQHHLLSRSAVQRIIELNVWRQRRQTTVGGQSASPEQLALMWKNRVDMCKENEDVSVTYVKLVFRAFDNLLHDKTCRAIILRSEKRWSKKSPFATIRELEAIMSRAKTTEQAVWCISLMEWYLSQKYLLIGDMSARNLTGVKKRGDDGQPDNRGHLDIFLEKQKMLTHLQTVYVNEKRSSVHPPFSTFKLG